MKTFVVLVGERHFIGNAETPIEAVQYAIARDGLLAERYVVYDHDLDRYEVTRVAKTPSDSFESAGGVRTPGG